MRSSTALASFSLLVSAISAGIAGCAFYYSSIGDPNIEMKLPAYTRVGYAEASKGDKPRAYMYVQPSFVSMGRTTRVEVIKNIELRVMPKRGEEPTNFTWVTYGKWTPKPDSASVNYEYMGEPTQLVISPTTPQVPVLMFRAPEGFAYEPGATHVVTLTADLSVNEKSDTEDTFRVKIPSKVDQASHGKLLRLKVRYGR